MIRGKSKARAGRQFMIRQVILSKVMRTLQDDGIKLVPRPCRCRRRRDDAPGEGHRRQLFGKLSGGTGHDAAADPER